jgi:regulator of RNase E activity RraB
MADDLPSDGDGNALRQVARDGSDMTKPMLIDFHVAVPNEESANGLATLARRFGYHVQVYESQDCPLPWTCQCSTRILADYNGVIGVQEELATISARFGGVLDGWGTFGNGPSGSYDVQAGIPRNGRW